jgi:hypothetical protein
VDAHLSDFCLAPYSGLRSMPDIRRKTLYKRVCPLWFGPGSSNCKSSNTSKKIIEETPGSTCASGLGVCTEPSHADIGVCVLCANVGEGVCTAVPPCAAADRSSSRNSVLLVYYSYITGILLGYY